jgi:hypothetical protein
MVETARGLVRPVVRRSLALALPPPTDCSMLYSVRFDVDFKETMSGDLNVMYAATFVGDKLKFANCFVIFR